MTNLRSIGRLDLLVSESYEGVESAPSGGLQAHLLLTEPLLLVLPRGETTPEPVALGTLRDTAWIAGLVGTQFAAVLEHACRSAGFGARVVHRADDAVLIQSLVRSGLGVALLPALACRDSEQVRFARATPAPARRRVHALVRRGAASRPALAATLEVLQLRASLVADGQSAGRSPATSRPGSSGVRPGA